MALPMPVQHQRECSWYRSLGKLQLATQRLNSRLGTPNTVPLLKLLYVWVKGEVLLRRFEPGSLPIESPLSVPGGK